METITETRLRDLNGSSCLIFKPYSPFTTASWKSSEPNAGPSIIESCIHFLIILIQELKRTNTDTIAETRLWDIKGSSY